MKISKISCWIKNVYVKKDENLYSKFETLIFEAIFINKRSSLSIKFNYLYSPVNVRMTHTGVDSYIYLFLFIYSVLPVLQKSSEPLEKRHWGPQGYTCGICNGLIRHLSSKNGKLTWNLKKCRKLKAIKVKIQFEAVLLNGLTNVHIHVNWPIPIIIFQLVLFTLRHLFVL